MSRFRKSEKRVVPIFNTASLPDLIFTLLFFFMITSNIKPPSVKVKMELPVASQTENIENEKTNLNLYIITEIKSPHQEEETAAILVDDNKIEIPELSDFIQKKYRGKVPQDVVVTLKADKHTPMGLVIDIKKILQKEGIQKIQYATKQ